MAGGGRVVMPGRGAINSPRSIPPSLLKRLLDLPAQPFVAHESGSQARAQAAAWLARTLSDSGMAPRDGSVAGAVDSMRTAGTAAESAGVVSLRNNFNPQSFYSSTLIEQALLTQNIAEPIVPSTIKLEDTAGYGVALYPSSETPIAVQLLLGGGKSGSSTIILKPGDAYVSQQKFDGLRWGLPFGWLGGGAVQLRIMQERDDVLFLPAAPEIVFHRIRLPIWGVTGNPAASGRGTSANWPRRFPWPNAIDQNGNPQKGQPSIGVTPTRTIFRLRLAALASTARVRFLLLKTDDLDLGSDGATLDAINTSGSWIDLTFPQTAASGFQIGGVATAEDATLVQTSDITCRPGGDSAIAIMLDMDGTLGAGTTLGTTIKCDVERFGTL